MVKKGDRVLAKLGTGALAPLFCEAEAITSDEIYKNSNSKMKKINLLLIVIMMFMTHSLADEVVESQAMESLEIIEPEPTAVSKVMERFSSLIASHEKVEKEEHSAPSEERKEDLASEADASLEIIEPIKRAKFETTEMPYPEDKKVEKAVKKEIEIKTEGKDSIADLEANARKVIEEETKKVEEAKANALKRISEAMSRLKEEKNKEF